MAPGDRQEVGNQVEHLQTLLVTLFGLMVALGSFAFVATLALTRGPRYGPPSYIALSIAHGTIGLITAAMARRGHATWGARLLSLSLAIIPTYAVVYYGTPHETAMASYVGVLLVTSVACSRREALLATFLLLPLAVLTYQVSAPDLPAEAIVSTLGLMLGTGFTLSWLQDTLRQTLQRLQSSEAHFQRLSQIDPLTGLGNRRQFDESLANVLAFASQTRPVALVLIDMDGLKAINDRYGHPMGDQALQAVAEAIRASIRDSDIACRIGGDEFAIILPQGGTRGAERICERLLGYLEEVRLGEGEATFAVSASVGVAITEEPRSRIEDLLAAADDDLYRRRALRRGTPNRQSLGSSYPSKGAAAQTMQQEN